jgi:hypothetical protein
MAMLKCRPLLARVASLLLAVGVSPLALADDQSDRIKALEQRLENSVKLIEALSARVVELERGSGTPPAKPDSEAVPARSVRSQEIVDLQENVSQISASLGARDRDSGLPLHGFADVGAAWSAGADPIKLRGFSVGSVDLYLTPQFGDRVKSLAEIVFEFDRDGTGTTDLERLQLGYTVSDELTLWLGRFHAPFGLWNTYFHHGANLQTSIYRPRFVEFEDQGGIIPAHSVGLWATGKTRLGTGRITYDAYLSNGPAIRERRIDPNSYTDDNRGKLIGLNLGYQPGGGLSGLTVGIHGFGSTVTAYDVSGAPLSTTRLRVAGGYFGYDADEWEAIGEYYSFRNADSGTAEVRSSNAWFVHVGRAFGSLTPYARYERTSLNPNDTYFSSQHAGRSYKRSVLGARYALDARSSFKLELSNTRESALMQIDENGQWVPFAGGSYRRAAFQYSIAF